MLLIPGRGCTLPALISFRMSPEPGLIVGCTCMEDPTFLISNPSCTLLMCMLDPVQCLNSLCYVPGSAARPATACMPST